MFVCGRSYRSRSNKKWLAEQEFGSRQLNKKDEADGSRECAFEADDYRFDVDKQILKEVLERKL